MRWGVTADRRCHETAPWETSWGTRHKAWLDTLWTGRKSKWFAILADWRRNGTRGGTADQRIGRPLRRRRKWLQVYSHLQILQNIKCEFMWCLGNKLCIEYIDPRTSEPILANRLIPLDKGEGAVRPIGVGEVIRRVIGKCVMKVTKEDVLDASGSLLVCADLRSGSEAAVHAMHSIFEEEETDAVLLIDAWNAFNALNRAAALHNIGVLCPSIATYVINTYRQPARLFITGRSELKSAEGTTQGDPLAMAIYAIRLQTLITRLGISSDAKHCWYADNVGGSGSLEAIK